MPSLMRSSARYIRGYPQVYFPEETRTWGETPFPAQTVFWIKTQPGWDPCPWRRC